MGRVVAFFGMLLKERGASTEVLHSGIHPIYVHTYFIRCPAAEYATSKPYGNLTRLSPCMRACETMGVCQCTQTTKQQQCLCLLSIRVTTMATHPCTIGLTHKSWAESLPITYERSLCMTLTWSHHDSGCVWVSIASLPRSLSVMWSVFEVAYNKPDASCNCHTCFDSSCLRSGPLSCRCCTLAVALHCCSNSSLDWAPEAVHMDVQSS